MKLGSLFDGSGGFPLAGCLCGIEPVWASEVEPYPIAVTRTRFKGMKHLGDISKMNGYTIEPADIITFGSPCQDLSVAGKRAGLKHTENGDEETTRSGLFMEAVRIIKEMRRATNGKYPSIVLWENVPGAFSSSKGEDFRTVLEELIKIVEPKATMPPVPQGGWAYADSYCGDGWSIAYRVFDAQYWGVPQRRRRIHLVLDLRGERAGKILFEREGLRGYFAEGGTPWKTAAADAQNRLGTDDRAGEDRCKCLTPWDCQSKRIFEADGVYPTLQAMSGGGANNTAVIYSIENHSADSRVDITENGIATDDRVVGDGCVGFDVYNMAVTGERTKTLNAISSDADHVPVVFEPVSYTIVNLNKGDVQSKTILDPNGISPSLYAGECRYGGGEMYVLDDQGGQQRGNVPAVVEQYLFENHSQDSRYKGPLDVCPMLPAQLGTGGNNQPFVVDKKTAVFREGSFAQFVEGECGTIKASGGRLGDGSENLIVDQIPRYIVRRLTPTECARLQGFPDTWGHPDHKDDLTEEEVAFWNEVRNTHAAINGKATKDYTKAQLLTWYNKLHTDSAEYKMWGNGIALPPALYVMEGIKDSLEAANETD